MGDSPAPHYPVRSMAHKMTELEIFQQIIALKNLETLFDVHSSKDYDYSFLSCDGSEVTR